MTRIALVFALLATATVVTATAVSVVPASDGLGPFAVEPGSGAGQKSAEKPRPAERNGLRPAEIRDALYKILKRDHALRDPRWSFLITVRDVDGDTLVDATFRHRTEGDNREFDLVIQAKRAVLHVDLTGKTVYAILEEPVAEGITPVNGRDVLTPDQFLIIPVPPDNPFGPDEQVPAKPALSPQEQVVLAEECLRRVEETHGVDNVWAVAGYRIGARALKELRMPRHARSLMVVHRFPDEAYAVMADGLQAATGASVGKRNLRLEETVQANTFTLIEDRNTGRKLRFSLTWKFVKSFLGAPEEFLVSEARRIASLPDDAIFDVRAD